MIDSYEFVVSRTPFVVRQRVRWGDCDPAGVVYTGKFSEYLLGAVNLFFAELGGGRYSAWIKSLDVDTPCKGMELVFHGALWPEDEFEMHCSVPVVRDHSFDIQVEAVQADGRRVFNGRLSPICISRQVRTRVPVPGPLREALARFAPPSRPS